MKKIILITAIVLISSYSFGQIGFGIKGAVTMSKLSTDLSDVEEAAKTGFQAGAFVRIGDKWHLQPEAYFTSKMGNLKFDVLQQSVEQTVTLNTIDIPVLIGYKILDPPTLNVRLQAGPVASIVANKSFKLEVDGVETPTDEEFKDSFKDLNWGLQFGAGVDFLMLTVDLRYELGLSNIYNKPDGATEDQTFKNNVFFLSVGWKIL